MKCEYIRKLIDETDRPDRLPVEVSGHLESCIGCRLFAGERSGLRGLLAAATVTAPSNFEAVLSQKLASKLPPQTSNRLIPARYAWIGAAAAAVLLMVFAVFQSGIYKDQSVDKQVAGDPAMITPNDESSNESRTGQTKENMGGIPKSVKPIPPGKNSQPGGKIHNISTRSQPSRLSTSFGDTAALILLRENSREIQVSIPAISVGAQPIAYVSQVSEGPGSQFAY